MVSITDIIASMTSQQRYLPFGQVRTDVASPNSQSLITDYGYTGQRNLDEGIGLMDYRARFYSPYLNHFTQPDSIVPDPTNPQDWNRYAYAQNNPLRYTDPTGHAYCDFIDNNNAEDCSGGLANSQSSKSNGGKGNGRNVREESNNKNCQTVTCKAFNGDVLSIIELLKPTHGGVRIQGELSAGFGYFGLSGSVGVNIVYNRIDDRLASSIDWAIEGGVGIFAGGSVTAGPLIGWASTDVDDATSGYSGIVSGTVAAGPAASVAAVAPLHVDPHYGQVPFTIFVGGGAGVGYAGAGGGLSGTFIQSDLTDWLPWR